MPFNDNPTSQNAAGHGLAAAHGSTFMSYFNEDQQEYIRSLEAMPSEQKCWCGWYRLGECPNCETYAPGKTCADKIAVRDSYNAGTQRPGSQDAEPATRTPMPGSLE